ncbi:MAG: tRNA pseudouridine(55) synthase TruB [Oscillospiraceae bacterium]|nr:tRNA pseudouridine(55) synthase TruB [Oscillospiraceae bacterium]
MNGIILVDKPMDWTSHDVVAKLRGALREKRVGHSGTLDPMATGLLVVFAGRATRAVEFAEAHSKEYIAGLRLGITTDTQDITGNVLRAALPALQSISENDLKSVICEFTGDIQQIPPMYSAIKVNGKKLYELARKGESVERKPRSVNISRLELVGREEADFILDVCCSKGTYIRTLCNDIGDRLGCGGCMSSLRRIKAGAFSVTEAHSVEEIVQNPEKYVLPVDTLFSELPELTVNANDESRLRNGNVIKSNSDDGKYRVYSESGEFLLLGEVGHGILKTVKSFFEVNNG